MTFNRGYRYRHVVDRSGSGHTVLSYLADRFTHSTPAEWQRRLDSGEIRLNDEVASASDVLRAGSSLVWDRPGWIESATPLHFEKIHHDEHLLAVNKPSGLPTLPGGGFFENTLLHLVRRDHPDARPMHRLGRATSGLVLFALDRPTASDLSQQWPHILKRYRALAQSVAPRDQYDIQTPIGPQPHPRLGTVHAANEQGKPSRSVARVLQRRRETTLFEVDLHTGRPHQIRIHLASIGHPLVGDPLYQCGGLPRSDNPGLPGDGGYALHAEQIEFRHPATEATITLSAPIPPPLQIDPTSSR